MIVLLNVEFNIFMDEVSLSAHRYILYIMNFQEQLSQSNTGTQEQNGGKNIAKYLRTEMHTTGRSKKNLNCRSCEKQL